MMFTVSNTNVGHKEVMRFYCEPIVATNTTNYATYNVMAFMYGGGLREEYLCIGIVFTKIVEDFFNKDVPDMTCRREGER